MSGIFPGSHSRGTATAMLRIQALFNFSGEKWEDFEIGAYTDNDQKAADCIAPKLVPGDLILQDLGYFTLDWLGQLVEDQYVITRWKTGVPLFDTENNKIGLLELFAGQKEVDMSVLVGAKKKLPIRLVARKLPRAKAGKRVAEAQKDRHSKANHSEEYYGLLKYELYLTNVPAEMLDGKNIAKLYGLRWHIEILFKSWKSYANFKAMFEKGRMNLQRTLFTIYAVLAEFVFLQNCIFKFIQNRILLGAPKYLSCLKFMDTVNDIFVDILNIRSLGDLIQYVPLFREKATYKKHSKRQKYHRKIPVYQRTMYYVFLNLMPIRALGAGSSIVQLVSYHLEHVGDLGFE